MTDTELRYEGIRWGKCYGQARYWLSVPFSAGAGCFDYFDTMSELTEAYRDEWTAR